MEPNFQPRDFGTQQPGAEDVMDAPGTKEVMDESADAGFPDIPVEAGLEAAAPYHPPNIIDPFGTQTDEDFAVLKKIFELKPELKDSTYKDYFAYYDRVNLSRTFPENYTDTLKDWLTQCRKLHVADTTAIAMFPLIYWYCHRFQPGSNCYRVGVNILDWKNKAERQAADARGSKATEAVEIESLTPAGQQDYLRDLLQDAEMMQQEYDTMRMPPPYPPSSW